MFSAQSCLTIAIPLPASGRGAHPAWCSLDAHLPRQAPAAAHPDAVLRVGADLLAAAAPARRSCADHGGRGPRPRSDRADPQAVPARSADPGAIRLLDQGRAHRRSWRVDAHQAAGARPRAAEAARDDAACRDGDRHRALDRDHGRHHLGGAEGHRLGLRRQRVRAVGAVHAEFLARHHADLPVLGAARLAAAVGLCAADGGLAASLAHHHHAGLRARQRASPPC